MGFSPDGRRFITTLVSPISSVTEGFASWLSEAKVDYDLVTVSGWLIEKSGTRYIPFRLWAFAPCAPSSQKDYPKTWWNQRNLRRDMTTLRINRQQIVGSDRTSLCATQMTLTAQSLRSPHSKRRAWIRLVITSYNRKWHGLASSKESANRWNLYCTIKRCAEGDPEVGQSEWFTCAQKRWRLPRWSSAHPGKHVGIKLMGSLSERRCIVNDREHLRCPFDLAQQWSLCWTTSGPPFPYDTHPRTLPKALQNLQIQALYIWDEEEKQKLHDIMGFWYIRDFQSYLRELMTSAV